MGNRFHRPYHGRYTSEALRARMNRDINANPNNDETFTILKKALYRPNNQSYLLAFSEYNTTKKAKIIEPSLTIHTERMKLVKDSLSGLIGISFLCDSTSDFEISVFYFAKEIIDTSKKAQYLSLDKERSPKPISLQCLSGKSQEIIISPTLDLSKFTQSELRFEDNKTFPVIIYLKNSSESVLYYFKIESGELVKVRESFSQGIKSYEVFDLYGKEIEECVVCMTEGNKAMAFPCRHVSCCIECLENIMHSNGKCPICRSVIKAGFILKG